MDDKTFEYMRDRVNQAREIKDKIKAIETNIARLEKGNGFTVRISDGNYLYDAPQVDGMRDAVLEVLRGEKTDLEERLAVI